MDKIIGTTLLISPDVERDTLEALKGCEVVILHFFTSGSESFSSLLLHFHKVCKQNHVQIIDVPLSKNHETLLHNNLDHISWYSVPSSEEGMRIAQNLDSEQLEEEEVILGSSLPRLIVFNLQGEIIDQNATVQIESVAQNEEASKHLIRTWKNIRRVSTMEKGNHSLTSSFLSKFKKLIVGDDVDSKDVSINDSEYSQITQNLKKNGEDVCFVIQTFLEEVSSTLQSYPTIECKNDFLRPLENTDGTYHVPISLSEQRKLLLQVQIHILEDVLSRQDTMSFTLQDIQEHLQRMGQNDFTHLTSDSTEQKRLTQKMNVMNEAARMAFVRSVLYAEMMWLTTQEHYSELNNNSNLLKDWPIDYRKSRRQYRRSIEEGQLDRDSVLEYCGLCIAAVNLDEVQSYIESGRDMFASHLENSCISPSIHSKVSTQHRILLLQQLMLCAIGFEPNYGGEEFRRILQQGFDGTEANDHELGEQISTYLLSMQTAVQKAMRYSEFIGLSDEQSGGVTRVVSVNYSEKILTDGVMDHARGSNVAPSKVKMEEHEEDEVQQHKDLKIAAKAASLQNSIMKELESMDEQTRCEVLLQAKKIHENVMSTVLSLDSGLERVQYLQTEISPEDQRLLLIHKLWENR